MTSRSPNVSAPRPKQGASPPILAQSGGAELNQNTRNFSLAGVFTSNLGLFRNPALTRRGGATAPLRQQSGGAS